MSLVFTVEPVSVLISIADRRHDLCLRIRQQDKVPHTEVLFRADSPDTHYGPMCNMLVMSQCQYALMIIIIMMMMIIIIIMNTLLER